LFLKRKTLSPEIARPEVCEVLDMLLA
jgi:hypothetical protein